LCYRPSRINDEKECINMPLSVEEVARIKAAPAWRPDKYDAYKDAKTRPTWAEKTMTGTVAAIIKRTSDYGEYPCVIIAVGDGEDSAYFAWHVFHQTAKDALMAAKPRPGEGVSVFYGGQKESRTRKGKDGKPVKYHVWTVVCENTMAAELGYDPYGADDSTAAVDGVPGSRSTGDDSPGF
jgi:hypothetical protein